MKMTPLLYGALAALWLPTLGITQGSPESSERSETGHYDGADWHLKGEGIVCCPCPVPCPCRTNGGATYGHCEATLYLHIREGHYGELSLNGLRAVETSGACGMSYEHLAALYFDRSATPEVQAAFMKILASFSATQTIGFPYVRTAPMDVQITDSHLFRISIPDILEMAVDRNWGQAAPPLPALAARDRFSNTLQYVQNLRYRMRDAGAKLDFDYSRRQANYRDVDLDVADYRARRMLAQYLDSSGWFNSAQLRIVNEQHLTLPDLEAIRREVARLRRAQGGPR